MNASELTSLPEGTRVRIALKGVGRMLDCLTGPAYSLDAMPAICVTRMTDGAEMAVALHTIAWFEVLDGGAK